jgi:hypothetical protein
MSFQPHHILLTVVAGECPAPRLELAWGVASPRLSVGSRADWVVRGEGISDVHLYLSFDGRRLRAATADDSAKAVAQGAELGVEWQELALPFELTFGSARLAGHVVSRSGALASSSLPDFAAGKPRNETRLGLPVRSHVQTQLLDLSALRPPALTRTVCDKGALRDYARQLAAQTQKHVSGGGESERAPEAGSLQLASAAQSRRRASACMRAFARSWTGLRRSLAALPIRRRLIALPVLASLGLLPWLWAADSASSAEELPGASREPVSNALAEVVTGTVAEADSGVRSAPPAPVSSAPVSSAPAQPSPRLEHDAFRAAFSGNVSAAVALYEQLAGEHEQPVFQEAARLLRQNRVYKP